jgi:ribosomal protein S18 acetylase RimI-like enzyme
MADIQIYTGDTKWDEVRLGGTSLEDALKTLWGKEIGTGGVLLPQSHHDHVFIFAAIVEGKIAGLVRAVCIETKSLHYAVIHDVIVDENYRGQGISKELMKAVIAFGQEKGLRYLDLTCNPKREVANHLYESVGFVRLAEARTEEPCTNYYRYFYS